MNVIGIAYFAGKRNPIKRIPARIIGEKASRE
jgi:rRNA processing protein Krr1/Pno1